MRSLPFGMNPELSFEENLADLRGLVANAERIFGLAWIDLAHEADLAYATVRNLGDGTTQQPRYATTLALQRVFKRYEARYWRYVAQTFPPAATTVTETSAPAKSRAKSRVPAWRKRPAARRIARRLERKTRAS